ncbi:MAG: TolC family protein [Pseudomonadota bacterium]
MLASEVAQCAPVEQIITQRLRADPQLDFIDRRIDEAKAERRNVKALWRPQVSTYLNSGIGSNGLAETQLGNQIGFEGRQRVFDFGDARRRAAFADAEISAREADRSEAQFDLIDETIGLYYDIVRADELIALSQNSQAILADRLATSEALLDDNLSTRSEVFALRMELQKERSDEALARLNRASATDRLEIMTGQKPNVCHGRPSLGAPVEISDSLLAIAEHDPAVQAAFREVEAASQALEIEKKSRLPVIEIVGRSGYAGTDFDDWGYEDRLSVSVRVPLYAGGQIEAGADKARARMAQAQAVLDQEKREAKVRVQVFQQKIISLNERLDLINLAIQNSLLERESIQTRIDLNAGTLLTFFEAHRRYVTLERDRIDTKRELEINNAQLRARLKTIG